MTETTRHISVEPATGTNATATLSPLSLLPSSTLSAPAGAFLPTPGSSVLSGHSFHTFLRLNITPSGPEPASAPSALPVSTNGSSDNFNLTTMPNEFAPGIRPYSPPRSLLPTNALDPRPPDGRQLNFENATRFFEMLEVKFQEEPDVYHLILGIIGDLLNPEYV